MNVDTGKVSAPVADGAPEVDIPKREEAKPKAVPLSPASPKPLAAGKK